jgi:hypothetical protein
MSAPRDRPNKPERGRTSQRSACRTHTHGVPPRVQQSHGGRALSRCPRRRQAGRRLCGGGGSGDVGYITSGGIPRRVKTRRRVRPIQHTTPPRTLLLHCATGTTALHAVAPAHTTQTPTWQHKHRTRRLLITYWPRAGLESTRRRAFASLYAFLNRNRFCGTQCVLRLKGKG